MRKKIAFPLAYPTNLDNTNLKVIILTLPTSFKRSIKASHFTLKADRRQGDSFESG